MKSSQHPVEDIVTRLKAAREAATPDQIREGREWYPSAHALCVQLADEAFDATGDPVTPEFCAGVIAAFSQNATWKANLTMARNYLTGKGQGCMASVQRELDRMEAGESPATAIGALKRPDFWRNITGDHSAVTCDRWHLRAAFGAQKMALTEGVHNVVTDATRKVAEMFGESPADCQAIIWCHVRGAAN